MDVKFWRFERSAFESFGPEFARVGGAKEILVHEQIGQALAGGFLLDSNLKKGGRGQRSGFAKAVSQRSQARRRKDETRIGAIAGEVDIRRSGKEGLDRDVEFAADFGQLKTGGRLAEDHEEAAFEFAHWHGLIME